MLCVPNSWNTGCSYKVTREHSLALRTARVGKCCLQVELEGHEVLNLVLTLTVNGKRSLDENAIYNWGPPSRGQKEDICNDPLPLGRPKGKFRPHLETVKGFAPGVRGRIVIWIADKASGSGNVHNEVKYWILSDERLNEWGLQED